MNELFELLFGKHKHKCPICSFVWEHGAECVAANEEVFERSHTCPACTQPRVYSKYHGDERARVEQVCSYDTIKTVTIA